MADLLQIGGVTETMRKRLEAAFTVHKLADEVVLAPGLAAHVVKVCAAMKPFLDYLKDVAG